MKKFLARVRFVRAAKRFLNGYKDLTENGVRRIGGLLAATHRLWCVCSGGREVRLCEVEKFDILLNIESGLLSLIEGTECGFVEFERLDVLGKLEILVKSGGRF